MTRQRRWIPVALWTIAGCGGPNPYQIAFLSEAEHPIDPKETIEPVDEVRILRSDRPEHDAISLAEQGYVYLGHSEFASGKVDSDRAREFAKDIGAAVVVLHSERAGVHMEYAAVQVHHPISPQGAWTGGDQLVTGNGFPYEFGGYVRGETKAYADEVQDYAYIASFWAKPHHSTRALGVHTLELTPQMQRDLSLDHGLVIYAVVRDTPADAAELRRGDILTHLADEPINVPGDFGKMLRARLGKTVEVRVLREGETLSKSVTLNKNAYWD